MLLFMIRHGETTGNVAKIFYGQDDLPLTENGIRQAESLRPLLGKYTFDRVYASDLSRAVATAKAALPECDPIPTPLLREYAMGSITGMTFTDVYARYGHPNCHYERFGGESPEDMLERLHTFLAQLEADPCRCAAAFVHSGTMKTMVSLVLDTQYRTTGLQSTNCNVAVFRFDGKNWSLAAWNLAGDLEGANV